MLALRLVLPALLASFVATTISWLVLPNAPPINSALFKFHGCACVGAHHRPHCRHRLRRIRADRCLADRNKPKGWWRVVLPVIALGLLGLISVKLPELLGNGRTSLNCSSWRITSSALLLLLLVLKPAATLICLGSGAPGGLFTPSLTLGALLGGVLGCAGSQLCPGLPLGLSAVLGAGAVLAATTQGPISAVCS